MVWAALCLWRCSHWTVASTEQERLRYEELIRKIDEGQASVACGWTMSLDISLLTAHTGRLSGSGSDYNDTVP